MKSIREASEDGGGTWEGGRADRLVRDACSNNPVIFPCVRIRDVAMMGLMSATGGEFSFPTLELGEMEMSRLMRFVS